MKKQWDVDGRERERERDMNGGEKNEEINNEKNVPRRHMYSQLPRYNEKELVVEIMVPRMMTIQYLILKMNRLPLLELNWALN
jgi:hypothetical protein